MIKSSIIVGLLFPIASIACTISNIEVTRTKTDWIKQCNGPSNICINMRGVADVTSKCVKASYVMFELTAYDKDWNSVGMHMSPVHIQSGKYTLSLDYWFDYNPEIKYTTLRATRIIQ